MSLLSKKLCASNTSTQRAQNPNVRLYFWQHMKWKELRRKGKIEQEMRQRGRWNEGEETERKEKNATNLIYTIDNA